MPKAASDYDHLLLPKATSVMHNAGFFRRMFAFLFDILLIDLLLTDPFTKVFTPMVERARTHPFSSMTYTSQEIAAIIVLFLIIYCYFVLFEYLLGQTMGMMLVNIRMQGEDSIMNAMIRNSFIFPFFPFILLWAIEPVAIAVWKRGVLEYATNTRTVHERIVFIK